MSDRYGRRAVMLGCAACETTSYLGLAFAHAALPIYVLVFIDRGLGWPFFLTASNAMTADLLRPRLRPQGYSFVRLMIGVGYIAGPLLAALVLALGAPLATLFVVAGAGCLAYLGFVLVFLKETHPYATGSRPVAEVSAVHAFARFYRQPNYAFHVRSCLQRRFGGSQCVGSGQPEHLSLSCCER